ncbi:hypothetical protein FA09DRAFT_98220 [Tilletiopsis washingtonensis]|uniref:Uncharacterized protein n=1 Tax=Tilletiopsis washingtonensis TaxID=58919 RepID=A0A316Z5N5_9BASI|nr:hypothetical protein FA09DRAFT_98220 [Tilletiopsis washingtonensis]PWN96278.1 hypothetical protein FA09DRAFT_98220 [Tilletiopsis washingtonensis]
MPARPATATLRGSWRMPPAHKALLALHGCSRSRLRAGAAACTAAAACTSGSGHRSCCAAVGRHPRACACVRACVRAEHVFPPPLSSNTASSGACLAGGAVLGLLIPSAPAAARSTQPSNPPPPVARASQLDSGTLVLDDLSSSALLRARRTTRRPPPVQAATFARKWRQEALPCCTKGRRHDLGRGCSLLARECTLDLHLGAATAT